MPTQVLYLPPLWFHEVRALEDTVGVNGWCESAEARAAAAIFSAERPTSLAAAQAGAGDAGSLSAVVAAASLVMAISHAALGSRAALGQLVWAERYAPLPACMHAASHGGARA